MAERKIELYQASDGQTQLEVTFKEDTVWLNQQQLTELFRQTKQNIKVDDIPLVPYFKCDVINQLNEFHLVFPSEPSTTLYENTIFSKLVRLATFSQSLRCFRYHYEAYPGKVEFLDFFLNEIPIRLTQPHSAQEKTILEDLLAEVNR